MNPKTSDLHKRRRPRTPLQQVSRPLSSCETVAKHAVSLELSNLEWHTVSPDELFRRLSTELTRGLSDEQVKRRLLEYGRNKPSPPQHIASSRSLDTYSKASDPFSSSDRYSASLAGNLSNSLRRKLTWPWRLFYSQSSSPRQLSMHGKTGLPQGSWHPSRPCCPKIRC